VSVFVWTMVGVALWHFTILVPDRFAGGIIGAFFAAWFGALLSGFVLDGFTLPTENPPGLRHAVYALPGAALALVACYLLGTRRDSEHRRRDAG
jgi:uncharacterized membrane protein YeaQ/YmgE (transglycosylase-associated protein family)